MRSLHSKIYISVMFYGIVLDLHLKHLTLAQWLEIISFMGLKLSHLVLEKQKALQLSQTDLNVRVVAAKMIVWPSMTVKIREGQFLITESVSFADPIKKLKIENVFQTVRKMNYSKREYVSVSQDLLNF